MLDYTVGMNVGQKPVFKINAGTESFVNASMDDTTLFDGKPSYHIVSTGTNIWVGVKSIVNQRVKVGDTYTVSFDILVKNMDDWNEKRFLGEGLVAQTGSGSQYLCKQTVRDTQFDSNPNSNSQFVFGKWSHLEIASKATFDGLFEYYLIAIPGSGEYWIGDSFKLQVGAKITDPSYSPLDYKTLVGGGTRRQYPRLISLNGWYHA